MHTTLIATLKKGTPVIMEQNAQTSQNYIQVVDSLLSMEDINYQSTSVCVVRQSGAGGGQRAFEFFLETDKTKGINVISNGSGIKDGINRLSVLQTVGFEAIRPQIWK